MKPFLLVALSAGALAQVSRPGAAGHALLFRNHIILKKDFKVWSSPGPVPRLVLVLAPALRHRLPEKLNLLLAIAFPWPPRLQNFPTDALTFEAWVSTSDVCNAGGEGVLSDEEAPYSVPSCSGTLLSYASPSTPTADDATRTADANSFVIFDPRVNPSRPLCPSHSDSLCAPSEHRCMSRFSVHRPFARQDSTVRCKNSLTISFSFPQKHQIRLIKAAEPHLQMFLDHARLQAWSSGPGNGTTWRSRGPSSTAASPASTSMAC